jgi:ankyrin repeat protein
MPWMQTVPPPPSLDRAIEYCHLEEVKNFIAVRENINKFDKYGSTPIIYAASKANRATPIYEETAVRDRLKIIEMLLDAGADVNLANNKNGWTPLMYACEAGYYGHVKLLLDRGANPNARLGRLRRRSTVLMIAAEHCSKDGLQALIERGADVTARTQKGDSALTYAQAVKTSSRAAEEEKEQKIAIISSEMERRRKADRATYRGTLGVLLRSLNDWKEFIISPWWDLRRKIGL